MDNREKCSTPMEEGTKASLTKSQSCDTNLPYLSLVGSLMYLYQAIRPDISFAVNILSSFSNCCQQEHWNVAKRVLRYLRGTAHYKLQFGPGDQDIVG